MQLNVQTKNSNYTLCLSVHSCCKFALFPRDTIMNYNAVLYSENTAAIVW